VKEPPASEPEPIYQVRVDGNNILIMKQDKRKSKSSQLELTLIKKDNVEGTDVMSFKFSRQNDQLENKTTLLDHTAGQFAFF
jgi:glycine betaine catabolism B